MQARRCSASGNVLLLLCAMYFNTYADRVNVSSAAEAFQAELVGIVAAFTMRPDQTFASDTAAKGRATFA